MNNPLHSQQISDVSTGPGAQNLVGQFRDVTLNLHNSTQPQESHQDKIDACRNHLYLTDPEIDRASLISAKGKRVNGTCEWIKENETFQSWLKDDKKLLWVYGGPGKGKTIVSIFLTEELAKTHEVVYYFCSAEDEERNKATSLLRGLLWQITTKCPDVTSQLLQYFNSEKRVSDTLSSQEALWSLFARLCCDSKLANYVYLIDGLDECDQASRDWLATKLIDVVGTSEPEQRSPTFRFIIISRDIPILRRSLQIRLDPDNNEQVETDIQRFIHTRVQELSYLIDFDDSFRKRVEDSLLERAEGTFLWVGFVMGELLKKRTRIEIEKTLSTLPKGLPAIYSRMLGQIPSGHRQISREILQWVTLSVRPLSFGELAAAVGCQDSPSSTRIELVKDHIALCGPLLTRNEQTVALVHHSARDFLLREDEDSTPVLEAYRIEANRSHLKLAWKCLDCLQAGFIQPARANLQEALREFHAQGDPLFDYAVHWWWLHANSASTAGSLLLKHLSRFFERKSDLRDNWWLIYRESDDERYLPPPMAPALHIACYLGVVPWVQSLLDARAEKLKIRRSLNQKDSLGRSSLSYAALQGHEMVVRILLDHKADLYIQDIDGDSALHSATRRGHGTIAKLLLDCGADMNAKGKAGSTALHAAVIAAQNATTRLLLDYGADINTTNNDGWTALHIAAVGGHNATMGLLLDHGADINATDNNGWTTLHLAASAEHETTTMLLLDRGANINATGNKGWTTLHLAALDKHETTTRLLLDRGSDINTTSNDGFTALHIAAYEGHEATTRLLLDCGADINATTDIGNTALYMAAYGGHETTTRLLLDCGADINATNSDGWTALYIAACQGHEATTRLLLDRGADVHAVASYGETALHSAALYGYEIAVRLLLSHGADPNTKDNDGDTALQLAARKKHEAIVQLLELSMKEEGLTLANDDEVFSQSSSSK